MITSNNIFKRTEIDPNRGDGWVVDLSGPDAVNPDCYWYFNTKMQAQQFADFVNNGMRPKEAIYNVYSNNAASILGSMTSERKAISSRENGRKGGRPRKSI